MKADSGKSLWICSLLIFISRLPFLFEGYGAEEDAWALRLVAERIATTGTYEVSRLPGHPVQELVYSAIWDSGAWIYNLLTALISTAGIHAFMLLLRRHGVANALPAGIALAFTPIVFIHSTDSMDYMWAVSFVLIAALNASGKRVILAGLLLGIACGCRITSGAMIIPLSILSYAHADEGKRWMAVARFALSTLFFSALSFLPVLLNYGIGFFTFYEHFPIPGWLKNTYKGTIGVWGLPGFLAVCFALVVAIVRPQRNSVAAGSRSDSQNTLAVVSIVICALYTIAFIRLPLKSAFMIPVAPFLLAWLAIRLSKRSLLALTVTLILSCFTFGINLAEEDRGSTVSRLAWTFETGGQKIAMDPLAGLVVADRSKRIQRIRYAERVMASIDDVRQPAVLITGWWQAHLLVLQRENERGPSDVIIRHYCSEEELTDWRIKGYTIYFLEGQDSYNDLRFRGDFTKRLATPWPYLRKG